MPDRDRNPDHPVVVVVAHGSRTVAANDAHRRVVAALAAEVGAAAVPAFLELAGPDIATAIDQAVTAGAGRVLVLPHFLYPGRHVSEDIPAIVAAAAERHPGVAVVLRPASGEDPAVAAALADLVRRALAR